VQKKKLHEKTEINVLWHNTSFPSDYGGYKQGCRLLFASHIGHNVILKEEKKA